MIHVDEIRAELTGVGVITSFDGTWKVLSNFYPCTVWMDEEEYPSVEHAYQASKTVVYRERMAIQAARKPGTAKALGQKVTLREDWTRVKVDVMEKLVEQKFLYSRRLADMLVLTRGVHLIEGNDWGDEFWGCVWVRRGQDDRTVGAYIMGPTLGDIADASRMASTRCLGQQNTGHGFWRGQNQLGRLIMKIREKLILKRGD